MRNLSHAFTQPTRKYGPFFNPFFRGEFDTQIRPKMGLFQPFIWARVRHDADRREAGQVVLLLIP